MIEAHVLDSWTRVDARDASAVPMGDDRRRVRRAAVPVPRRRRGRALGRIEAPPDRRRRGRHRRRSCGAGSGSSSWRSCSACRPGSWAGRRRERCSRSTSSTSWGRRLRRAAALWGAFRTPRARVAAFAATTLAIALADADRADHAAPRPAAGPARGLHPPDSRARRTSASSRGPGSCSPAAWSACCSTTCAIATRKRASSSRLFAGGAALALGAYAASFLPSPYTRSEFWGSSPAFFLLRVGVVIGGAGRSRMRGTRARPCSRAGARCSSSGGRRCSSTGSTWRWSTG